MHMYFTDGVGGQVNPHASTVPGISQTAMNLRVIGLNYRTATVAIRERFAFGPEMFHKVLNAFREHCHEHVLLNTCNRTEWIFIADERGQAACAKAVRELAGISEAAYREHVYEFVGRDALVHICRVAAGLDSMVPGETQVLGQFKQAFGMAFEEGTAGADLLPVFHQVLRVAKDVRNRTAVGDGVVSYGTLAVQAARETLGELADCKAALVGAGKMSRLVGRHLREGKIGELRVLNRDGARGATLAGQLQAQRYSLDDLEECLEWADLVVSSTACPHAFITRDIVSRCQELRGGRPLVLVDLAVPRDIEPEVAELPGVRLLNIDDFEKLITENREVRQERGKRGEVLINELVDTCIAESRVEIGSVIQALQQRARQVRETELEKLFRRFDQWSEEEQEQVSRSVRLIMNRFLHDPIVGLREAVAEAPEDGHPGQAVTHFQRLFRLDMAMPGAELE